MSFRFISLARVCMALAISWSLVLSANAGPAGAIEIILEDVAADRIERQRKARKGELPLPGTPDLSRFTERLAEKGFAKGDPVLIRIFKETSELEVWMGKNGRFELFANYPICHWSGTLGPKLAEGARQSPEGFYNVTRRKLHRSGRWPRSLNLGFPNVYDRSLSRSGSYILIHGGCSSVGCYAMTDPVNREIFTLVEAAFKKGGQEIVPVHVFPFRMTEANLDRFKTSQWYDFWRSLKPAYDAFEDTRRAPDITVCKGTYEAQPVSIKGPDETETAFTGRKFKLCKETAELLEAYELLDRIALKPALWAGLPQTRQQRLTRVVGNKAIAKARSGKRRLSRTAAVAPRVLPQIDRRTKRRLRCNPKKPSCQRYMAVQRRSATAKSKSAARSQTRRQAASSR